MVFVVVLCVTLRYVGGDEAGWVVVYPRDRRGYSGLAYIRFFTDRIGHAGVAETRVAVGILLNRPCIRPREYG